MMDVMVSKNVFDDSVLIKSLPIDDNIKSKFEFAESINNVNSTIIHSICCAIELFVNIDKGAFLKIFKRVLRIEINHSIFHTAKVLWKSGFKSYDSFFNNTIFELNSKK